MTAYATPTVQELGDFQTRTGEWVVQNTYYGLRLWDFSYVGLPPVTRVCLGGGGRHPPPPLLRCSRALTTTIERTRVKGGEPCRR